MDASLGKIVTAPLPTAPARAASARVRAVFSAKAPARRVRAARLIELVWVALAAAAVSFAGIGSHALWTPDEPRDAALGKTMLASRDWTIPRLNGEPFLEKPPLTWWIQAATYRTLGVSDAAARVPSALCATLTLLVTFALGRRLGGRSRAGWLAAGVLASTAEFGEDMRRAIVDPPMVLMVTLTYAGFAALAAADERRAATAGEDAARRADDAAAVGDASGRTDDAAAAARTVGGWSAPPGRRAAAGFWGARLLVAIAATLAFLAKGMVGLGLALGPPLAYLLATGGGRRSEGGGWQWRRRWREAAGLLVPLAVLGVPVFAALTVPWALSLVHEGGWAALRECLVGNTIGRLFPTAAGRVYGHRLPFWYYLPAGAAVLLPWTLALPAVLLGGRPLQPASAEQAGAGRDAAEAPRRMLLACFFLGTLLLSVAASKRTVYLVPLLPALAIPIGLWLDRLGNGAPRTRWDRPTALLLLGLAACLPPALWVGAWEAARGAFHSFPAAPLRTELTAGCLTAAGLLAAAAALVLALRLARDLRAGATPSGPWLVLPFLTLTLVYQTAVKAVIDPLKNPHDLTAAIARLDPGPAPVVAYRPSETLLGLVAFDLDRRVQPLADPAELAALLAASPDARLVLPLDAWRRLPPPLRARLRLLYDETATKASPYAIAAPAPRRLP
jgi:4-amino-4-deoxy-L-arabinose transferase-like glycosyltransferase